MLVGLFAITGACGKTHEEKFLEGLVEDATEVVLPQIRASISSGRLDDAIHCSRVTGNLKELERSGTYDDVVADIKQVCEHDLDIAHMKRAVEAAEAARRDKPDEKVLRACFSAELGTATRDLYRAKRFDSPAEALLARFAGVCPDQVDDYKDGPY